MSTVLAFFLGAVFGGFLGMILTALVAAGDDDEDERP